MKIFNTVILKKEDHIATLIMNRPEVMNAITLEMFDEILEALKIINEDDDIRVMIFTGAGKAFTASVDIKVSGAVLGKRMFPHMTINEVRENIIRRQPQQITRGLINLQKPTIAMLNGMALADGFDWALACDIRIGTKNTRFMNAFTKVALFPNTGGTWLHARHFGIGKALELMYTGDWLEAEEAFKLHVLNKLVPEDKLEEETMALARKIAEGPPAAIRLMKMQTYKGLEIGLDSALELAADGEALMMTTDDHIEAVSAWLEKRKPKFTGK